MWQQLSDAPVDPGLRVELGPERIIFTDGLQPFMFRSRKGTLWFQAGTTPPVGWVAPQKNVAPPVANLVSRDNGKTWKRACLRPDQGMGPVVLGGECLSLADGREYLLEWMADGPDAKGEWRGRYWESHDDLATLEGPKTTTIHLPQARGGFDDSDQPYSGMTIHRTLLQLPNGDLLATAYCFFEGDTTPCTYQPTMFKSRVILLRSQDGGKFWRYVATVAVDPAVGEEGFTEPVMVRLTKGAHAGRLVTLMRTGSNNCAIHQSHSDDEGATWSRPRALEFGGVDPDLIEMDDGTLACSFGWRIWGGGEMQNYYLVFSRDGGETWINPTVLPIELPAAAPWPSGTWYSSLRQTSPGTLLVIYDVGAFGREWPVKYIAGRQVRVSV